MAESRGRIDVPALKATAAGQWDRVFEALTRNEALLEAMSRTGKKLGPCPVNGGSTKFRLFPDWRETGGGISNDEDPKAITNGISLIMWVNNWDFRQTITAIADYLDGNFEENAISDAERRKLEERRRERERRRRLEVMEEEENLRRRLNQVWCESLPANHPKAEPLRKYLIDRGLDGFNVPERIRYHPALPYTNEDGEFLGEYPAMVSIVQNVEGKPVTLHRIYLSERGKKAPVEVEKKTMGYVKSEVTFSGAALRFGEIDRILHVGEGIESTLAVKAAIGESSMMATLNSGNMAALVVPPHVERVVIWADHDRPAEKTGKRAGIEAATRLRETLGSIGIPAEIMLPERPIPPGSKSVDWNDILEHEGARVIKREYERAREAF